MGTKFDCRNDSAWHFKNQQKYSLAAIIATGTEMAEVETLDELQLLNEEGCPITHKYITDQLSFLNGETLVSGFATTTTMHRINQGQKAVSALRRKLDDKGISANDEELEVRERRKILDTVDKQMLQV